jgi:hypothetical protein
MNEGLLNVMGLSVGDVACKVEWCPFNLKSESDGRFCGGWAEVCPLEKELDE